MHSNSTLLELLATLSSSAQSQIETEVRAIESLINEGDFTQANIALTCSEILSNPLQAHIRQYYNEHVLLNDEREWTTHGICRTFRFWSQYEKQQYLKDCANLLSLVQQKIPYSCFGFGSVLGFTRSGNLIPHDDDLDLIAAVQYQPDASLARVLLDLESYLGSLGLVVYKRSFSHLTLGFTCRQAIDLFVGFYDENGAISWFPSDISRKVFIEDLFPPKISDLFGVGISLPRDSEKYLEVVYGEDWRQPISDFRHAWNRDQFSDFS